MNCKETFSDIVAAWAFPAGAISYTIPFNVRKRIYTLSDLGWTDTSILNGMPHYSVGEDYAGAGVVELAEQESILRSTTVQTAAGRAHDVSLSLIINENSEKAKELGEQLERERHDFIVQIADGSYLLVRTADNAYQCQTDEEFAIDYRLKHTINIQNLNGIIRLVID